MGLEIHRRERSSVWQAHGTIKIDGKSRFVRRSLKTKDPTKAQIACRQLEIDLLLGKVSMISKPKLDDGSFSALIHRYKKDGSTGKGATTNDLLDKFDEIFGDRPVRSFDKADIAQYTWTYHTEKGHSNSHTRRVLTQLQSLLNYGHEQGWRDAETKIKKPKEDEGNIVTVSDDEYNRILRHLPSSCRRVAQFMLHTGARPHEAFQLTKDNVSWSKKTVELSSIKGSDRTRRKRTVPMNHLAYAATHGSRGAKLDMEGDYIFTYEAHGYHKPFDNSQYFTRKWGQACHRAGIEGKTPYSLRHTFGTRLGKNNTPFAVISKLMGHTNPKTTMLYVHPEFEDDVSAVMSLM